MHSAIGIDQAPAIRAFLDQRQSATDLDVNNTTGLLLAAMIEAGLDRLVLPGDGQILLRWQALAAVAAHDLSLTKLYEGHTDALAILAEAGVTPPVADSRWGVWCAEPPQARVEVRAAGSEGSQEVKLSGIKAWCSGARVLTHAILSGWNEQGQPCLVAVDLYQPGIVISDEGWHAVGMANTMSVNVQFNEAHGIAVGSPGFYTRRPGFWHGAAGIAACWYGAAAQLVHYLREHLTARNDPHALAHLGRADMALNLAACALRAAAQEIDAAPLGDSYHSAMRVRLGCEWAATQVMQALGQALGAAPYCRDPWSSRMLADLPVFLRQSHAERDLAALGRFCAEQEHIAREHPWQL